MWTQAYDPFDNMLLSVLAAAIPIVVLLAAIGILEVRAHVPALVGLGCALAVATLVFGMPLRAASSAALFGAAFGLMPAGCKQPHSRSANGHDVLDGRCFSSRSRRKTSRWHWGRRN